MCKKLKLPIKVYQAFIILIMVTPQQGQIVDGQTSCFGPVSKINMFTSDLQGFVYVDPGSKQLRINQTNDAYFYQISTTGPHQTAAFYLFDPTTNLFLCWKKVNGTIVTRNYDQIDRKRLWHLCKFTDQQSKDPRYKDMYVQMELAGHPGTIMQFDSKGRNISQQRTRKCLMNSKRKTELKKRRHSRSCWAIDNFMTYTKDRDGKTCCREAVHKLCRSKGRIHTMPELREHCNRFVKNRFTTASVRQQCMRIASEHP